MKILRPLVILLGLAFFIGITWISSDIYIAGLNLGSATATTIHSLILLFWAVFLVSYFSGQITSAAHVKFLYLLSNVLFGIMFYIFLGSLLLSATFLIFPSVTITFAYSVLAVSLLFGILGILQSRIFQESHYEVVLPNAPDSWDGKRAIFISDTHFGLVHGHQFADKVVDKILKINPDFVLHGGDFYDGPTIHLDKIITSWKKLTSKIPMFYTSGNHELYGNYDAFVGSLREIGATVLLDTQTTYDGVQIAGITYRAKGADIQADTAIDKLGLDPNIPTILINHPPTFHKGASNAKINLMVSGHTHRGQFSPIWIFTRLVYKKFHYGAHKFEDMHAITSRGVGTAGPPVRLFNNPEFVIIKFRNK